MTLNWFENLKQSLRNWWAEVWAEVRQGAFDAAEATINFLLGLLSNLFDVVDLSFVSVGYPYLQLANAYIPLTEGAAMVSVYFSFWFAIFLYTAVRRVYESIPVIS